MGLAWVRVVVREVAIDIAVQWGVLDIQQFHQLFRGRPGNAIAGINHHFQIPADLHIAFDTLQISLFKLTLFIASVACVSGG